MPPVRAENLGRREPLALLLCDSGREEPAQAQKALNIGQGHLFRCHSFAAQLRLLGWRVLLLELRLGPADLCGSNRLPQEDSSVWALRAAEGQIIHYVYSLSATRLKGLRALSELSGWPKFCRKAGLPRSGEAQSLLGASEPRLLLVDSYQVPMAFYHWCTERFSRSRLLALDDFERLDYPPAFSVLQVAAPPVPSVTGSAGRYLRGLQYQVLRPEFSTGYCENNATPEFLPSQPYLLLVPGSAFSPKQLHHFLALLSLEMRRQTIQNEGCIVCLLLSPRQNRELKFAVDPALSCYSDLNAAQLRLLYLGARQIVCAAGQSLLELLALSFQMSPGPEGMTQQARICALLTADNQVAQLDLLRQSGIQLPCIDLRTELQSGLSAVTQAPSRETAKRQYSIPEQLSCKLRNALAELNVGPQGESAPWCASPLAVDTLRQLGDGRAMLRILHRLGLG